MSGKVLITRPLEQAQSFAKEVEALGGEVLIMPLLELRAVAHDAPDLNGFAGLVFTSVNGVRFFDHFLTGKDLKVFAVGRQTREALEKEGYLNIECVEGRAADLDGLLSVDGRYLHVCGVDVAYVFGAHVEPLIVYQAEAVSTFSEEVIAALENQDVGCVLLFSARTAKIFDGLIVREGLDSGLEGVNLLSISGDVLKCVHTYGWRSTAVADTPDRGGMIEKLKGILNDG